MTSGQARELQAAICSAVRHLATNGSVQHPQVLQLQTLGESAMNLRKFSCMLVCFTIHSDMVLRKLNKGAPACSSRQAMLCVESMHEMAQSRRSCPMQTCKPESPFQRDTGAAQSSAEVGCSGWLRASSSLSSAAEVVRDFTLKSYPFLPRSAALQIPIFGQATLQCIFPSCAIGILACVAVSASGCQAANNVQ